MKKGDKVNTTCVEGTFTIQSINSKGMATLKGEHGMIMVPVSTLHPAGSVKFEDDGVKRRVLIL